MQQLSQTESLEFILGLKASEARSFERLQRLWPIELLDERLSGSKRLRQSEPSQPAQHAQVRWQLIRLPKAELQTRLGLNFGLASEQNAGQNSHPHSDLGFDGAAVLRPLRQALEKDLGQALYSLELNQRVELPQVFSDLELGRRNTLSGWWRRETGVERAWDYSLGTGVQAAYMDLGFSDQHPEYASRLILNGRNNQTREQRGLDPNNIQLPQGDHGTASLLVGFAERENGIPSAGVAPNAGVAPYVASDVWEAAAALEAALESGAEVIGMNFAFSVFPRWQSEGDFQKYGILEDVVGRLKDYPRAVLVVPAHNFGEPVSGGPREWIPVSWSQDHPQVIGVGGVQINGEQQVSAWINPALLTGVNARGSNYAPYLIWAPSVFLDTASTHPDGLLPNQMSGTSASCPFITGTIALIKSRFPQISGTELKRILRQSARQIPAEQLTQQQGDTIPLVQVEQALRLAIEESGRSADSFRARSWEGVLRRDEQLRYWLETLRERIPILPSLAALRPDSVHPEIGQRVRIDGWRHLPGLPPGELEVKRIRRLSHATTK